MVEFSYVLAQFMGNAKREAVVEEEVAEKREKDWRTMGR
jgi:hypothetical protein